VSNYFVFTDEAGTYQRHPSVAHITKHPFYIRSNVLMSIDDYRQYQIDLQRISGECDTVPQSTSKPVRIISFVPTIEATRVRALLTSSGQ